VAVTLLWRLHESSLQATLAEEAGSLQTPRRSRIESQLVPPPQVSNVYDPRVVTTK
jgi:hypothetical protein